MPFTWSTSPFASSKPDDLPDTYNYTWFRYDVPYPPHGHFDGWTPIGRVIAILVGTSLAAALVGAVLVRMTLQTNGQTQDAFSESVGLLKNRH